MITGITGQDGAYLAELLLEKNTWSMVPIVGLVPLIFGELKS